MNLKDYLKKNGVMQKWFAKQLKINEATLSYYLHWHQPVNMKHWNKIIELTGNQVTLYDLMLTHSRDLKGFNIIKEAEGDVVKIRKLEANEVQDVT